MKWKCLLFLSFLPWVASAQGPLTPQLKTLLDFYFRGPGASNTVTREQIRDSAIDLTKLDTDNVSSFYATRSFVNINLATYSNYADSVFATGQPLYVFTEVDPVWASEKAQYALQSQVPGLETDSFLFLARFCKQ